MDKVIIEKTFQDYQALCKMNTDIKSKIKMLSILLYYNNTNAWRIEGITKEALLIFKENNFKYKSKMGINRAHQCSRNDLYKKMLETPIEDVNNWWNEYYKNDITILATSTQNIKNVDLIQNIPIVRENNLFKNRGFVWKHGIEEEIYLRNLYEANFQ